MELCQTKILSRGAKGNELDSNVKKYNITWRVFILLYETVQLTSHMVHVWLHRGKPCQVSMAVQQQGNVYNREAAERGGDNNKRGHSNRQVPRE